VFSQPFLIVVMVEEKNPKGEKASGVNRQPIRRTSAIKRTSAMVFPADVAISNLLYSIESCVWKNVIRLLDRHIVVYPAALVSKRGFLVLVRRRRSGEKISMTAFWRIKDKRTMVATERVSSNRKSLSTATIQMIVKTARQKKAALMDSGKDPIQVL
jgi:hypothetical protein